MLSLDMMADWPERRPAARSARSPERRRPASTIVRAQRNALSDSLLTDVARDALRSAREEAGALRLEVATTAEPRRRAALRSYAAMVRS